MESQTPATPAPRVRNVQSGCYGNFRQPVLAKTLRDIQSRRVIASLNILTPKGPQPVRIEIGGPKDDRAIWGWRTPSVHTRPELAADAIEFATLAGKRWRYYLRRGEAVTSIPSLQRRIADQPDGEFGFLLIARPTWRPAPSALGIAWCRRTWCHHIVLDFLAVHPKANDPAGGFRGLGGAMLMGVAAVASAIDSPLVWGEATGTSSTFYQKILGEPSIQDHFFIAAKQLQKLRDELLRRTGR